MMLEIQVLWAWPETDGTALKYIPGVLEYWSIGVMV